MLKYGRNLASVAEGDKGVFGIPKPRVATAENLIYVIYTSGSTGVPKGVSVTHRAVNRLIFNTHYVELTSDDRVAQASNASFDAATFEIWGALLHGAQLHGVAKEIALSPKDFAAEIRDKKISIMFLTTALFNQIARESPSAFGSMRQLMFGGEAVEVGAVKEVLQHGKPERLVHVYGPTESTTFATACLIDSVPAGATTVPIGRAISNTETFILDAHLNPTPVGVPGELYLGGDGLARGYLNRPDLTAERFVCLTQVGERPVRAYRTGDLARRRADGAFEFLGRTDDQVKIRGHRIEPGEVEATLRDLPQVRAAAVVAREVTGDLRLVAYIVPAAPDATNPSALRAVLRQKLPDYMVPSHVVMVATLPMTPNGKIDRGALPPIAEGRPSADGLDSLRLEDEIARIWRAVLGVSRVGLHDSFFDLGGDTTLTVEVQSRLHRLIGWPVPLADLTRYHTVQALADRVRMGERTVIDDESERRGAARRVSMTQRRRLRDSTGGRADGDGGERT